MAYTIINNSTLEITRGSEFRVTIIASSSKSSRISKLIFSSDFLGIKDRELEIDELGDRFILNFTAEETEAFQVGNGYYYLKVTYSNGTQEEKPYVGMLRVRDLAVEASPDGVGSKEEGG